MNIGFTLLILAVLIIAIWVIVEIRRFKHKMFAILLILFILFCYVSFTISMGGKNIDFKTVQGLTTAGKIYFAWVGSAFANVKSITSYAVKRDWNSNETIG